MLKKIKYLNDYFKYLNNPFEVLKFKFGFIKTCTVKLKQENYQLTLSHVSSLNKLMSLLPRVKSEATYDYLRYIESIDKDDKYFNISGIKFMNLYNSDFNKTHNNNYYSHLTEFFTDDVLKIINYSNRHVVDIGGNIGDTALFFANENADVISFEPVKHLHDLAVENVNLNPKLKRKITLVNKAIGGKRGKLSLDSTSIIEYVDDESNEIEVITIEDLFNQFNFTPDILKMDCEGCEFEIIEKYDLSMFNEIIFEHHSKIVKKDYQILVNRLKKQGFKIKFFDSTGTMLDFEKQGMIYAYK